VKVIEPGPLLREAADVLDPVWPDVVLIGAAALQIVLAEDLAVNESAPDADTDPGIFVVVTATRDVDVAVESVAADAVVAQLEQAGMQPSDEPGERGFTWVRGDLKIQLVRPYDPFPKGAAAKLPDNTHVSLLAYEPHRLAVAFATAPDKPRLQSATAAAFVALKQVAFGRDRYDGSPVERDFHDVYAVIASRPAEFEASYRAADHHVRSLVDRALQALAADGEETAAAARQHALIAGNQNVAAHARAIVRDSVFMQRRLEHRST
jgi:hypothetical protein